jgi:hypothetical protein
VQSKVIDVGNNIISIGMFQVQNYICTSPNVAVEWLEILLLIREIQSNIGPKTGNVRLFVTFSVSVGKFWNNSVMQAIAAFFHVSPTRFDSITNGVLRSLVMAQYTGAATDRGPMGLWAHPL